MDYREAGVDISAADAAKDRIKALARSTFNPSVLTEIGSFGGMFRPDLVRYREPVLVASTDGVGTKIRVAVAAGVHDTVGYDLVAHCVDDILVQGAVPLFFLDYVALGKMEPAKVEAIVAGFARACAEFGCPLLGGETAEMPGTYAEDDYDLAGFIVGILEKDRALPRGVREGDVLVGPPLDGTAHQRVLARPQGPLRRPGPPRGHPPARARGDGRGGAAGHPPQLPGRPRAASRARQDPRPRPHHRRRLRGQHSPGASGGSRGSGAPQCLGHAAAVPPHPGGRRR